MELENLIKQANEGDVQAQNELGKYYYKNKDYNNALKWFLYRKNPSDENVNKILSCYDNLSKIDNINVVDLYKSALVFESSKILLEVGAFFEYGKRVEKDLKQAFEFYIKAAQKEYCLEAYSLVLYFAYTYSDIVEDCEKIKSEYAKKIQLTREKRILSDLEYTLDDLFD